jgi:hypothetical protein
MKLQESCVLSCSTVQTILDSFNDVIDLTGKNVMNRINVIAHAHGISEHVRAQIGDAAIHNDFTKALDELSTDWKRKKYYKTNLHFVEPLTVKYVKGNDLNNDSFQYIPLLDSLKMLLTNTDILSHVLRSSETNVNMSTSFRDGKIFKDHKIFQSHPCAIPLIISGDEFEVVNALGPHASKHKILAFYYTISSLTAQFNSRKDVIQLLALCNSQDVKTHGLGAIADIINDDLKVLEQTGITVSGSTERLYGSLAYIAGDNLNSHLIGGFNASFSPNVLRPCRFCLISNIDLQTVIECDKLQCRTKDNYDEQVSVIECDPSQKTNFGIRYKSPFNQGLFHVVDRFPPDIMHDMLEGVVPLEMALVLQNLISQGHITVQKLNQIINSWLYGPMDRQNKLVPLSESFGDKVKQNAGRMWCLLRLHPLMIGSYVPVDNVHWKFLLELKDIVELVLHTNCLLAMCYL